MKFVIITPAYNEEKYIIKTIKSVLKQAVKPVKWIIVDDGSTDETARIIKEFTYKFDWIEYAFRVKDNNQSYYASNVYAIRKGIEMVEQLDIDYIAILDADISLPPNYYQLVFRIFAHDKFLGIVSGNCADVVNSELKRHLYDRRSCAKAIMVFKKQCFKEIGGFIPLKYGGEDTVACFSARMHGWKTWAFKEMIVPHNKPLGTGPSKNMLKIRYRQGIGEYYIGSHPIFVILKSIRRLFKESPFILGSFFRIFGFISGYIRNEKGQVPKSLKKYIRKEQFRRVLNNNQIPEKFKINSMNSILDDIEDNYSCNVID